MTKLELLEQNLDNAKKTYEAFTKQHRERPNNCNDICFSRIGEHLVKEHYVKYTPEEEAESMLLRSLLHEARDLFVAERSRVLL